MLITALENYLDTLHNSALETVSNVIVLLYMQKVPVRYFILNFNKLILTRDLRNQRVCLMLIRFCVPSKSTEIIKGLSPKHSVSTLSTFATYILQAFQVHSLENSQPLN